MTHIHNKLGYFMMIYVTLEQKEENLGRPILLQGCATDYTNKIIIQKVGLILIS